MALDPEQVKEAKAFGRRGMMRSAFNAVAIVGAAIVGFEFGPVMAFGAAVTLMGALLVNRVLEQTDAKRTIDKVPPHLRDELDKTTVRAEQEGGGSKRSPMIRKAFFSVGGAMLLERMSPLGGFVFGALAAEAIDFDYYYRRIYGRADIEPKKSAAAASDAPVATKGQESGISKYLPNIFK